MVRVHIPTPLRSYTGGRPAGEVGGGTLAAVLEALDRTYPGLRFRVVDEQGGVRRHIKLFVGAELIEDLAAPLEGGAEVSIICALSGG
jgi:sulfur-carrier protein